MAIAVESDNALVKPVRGKNMNHKLDAAAHSVHPIVTMPFALYYDSDGITIYNADCRKVLSWIEPVDLLLTDPPYGIDLATSLGISGPLLGSRSSHCYPVFISVIFGELPSLPIAIVGGMPIIEAWQATTASR